MSAAIHDLGQDTRGDLKDEDLFGSDDENSNSGSSPITNLVESNDGSDRDEKIPHTIAVIKPLDATDSNYFADDKPDDSEIERDELDDILGDGKPLLSGSSTKRLTSSRIELVDIEKIPNSTTAIYFRNPNFLSFESRPFEGQPESSDRNGKAPSVVRWRYRRNEETGEVTRESNARLVKRTDGTYQMIVGDAIFNADIDDLDNCFIFQKHEYTDADSLEQKRCFECAGRLQSKMIVKPVSLDSEVHTRMSSVISRSIGKTLTTQQRDIEEVNLNCNPEMDKQLRAKEEEAKLRKQRKVRTHHSSIASGAESTYYQSRRPSMSTEYLNDVYDEEEDITTLKNQFKNKAKYDVQKSRKAPPPYKLSKSVNLMNESDEDEDEEEEEDDDDRAFIDRDGDDDDGEDLFDDEEEDEYELPKKPDAGKAPKNAFFDEDLDDNDDDEEEEFVDDEDDEDEEDIEDQLEDDDDDDEIVFEAIPAKGQRSRDKKLKRRDKERQRKEKKDKKSKKRSRDEDDVDAAAASVRADIGDTNEENGEGSRMNTGETSHRGSSSGMAGDVEGVEGAERGGEQRKRQKRVMIDSDDDDE